jgi:hypothetical protein
MEYENICSYKKIIMHQLLEMTFSKMETSYVAYSQKRAVYDQKGGGWRLSERQVWQVQDRWWFTCYLRQLLFFSPGPVRLAHGNATRPVYFPFLVQYQIHTSVLHNVY